MRFAAEGKGPPSEKMLKKSAFLHCGGAFGAVAAQAPIVY
jgi:hypothetical protein